MSRNSISVLIKLRCGDQVYLPDDPRHVGRGRGHPQYRADQSQMAQYGWISCHDRDVLNRLKPWEHP